ncbi:MAG: hypothetical protein KGR24_10360 [Planctomycetes bacterium]|nr:hypothetical protein [Planctomycetota bacterium]
MKTKGMSREQVGRHNRRKLQVGDRVVINFAGRYWANGQTGEVVDILGHERRLFGVRVASQDAPTGYCTIDCPASQIIKAAM